MEVRETGEGGQKAEPSGYKISLEDVLYSMVAITKLDFMFESGPESGSQKLSDCVW